MSAACIALPLVLFVVQGITSYQSTWANADLEIARTRDIAREHAVKVLETIERSLSEIGEIVRGRSDDELRTNERPLHEKLAAIADALPQMKSAWVIDADGHTLVSSLVYPAPRSDFSDRDYFAVHRDRDIGTYLGRVLMPRVPFGGQAFFSMSRRRPAENGAFTGIIQASILPDYFEQFYRQIGFENGSLVVLALTDGMILASNPPFPLDTQISAGGTIGRSVAQSSDAGLFTVRFSADGVERRVAYQKLAGYPVYVAAGLSTDTIVARWFAQFARLLVIAVPGTLLLFAMLWLYFRGAKRLYEESANRERAEAALRQNQRLEALGQLTGGVAHDFNNLLTVIGSSADLLRRNTLTDERRLRYVDAIAQTVARATKLTDQLLAFARRQPLTTEVFEAGERIESMAGMLGTLIGSSVTLTVRRGPRRCLVETDASQFDTAIINLAANARDAMPHGGTLTVTVDRVGSLPDRFESRDGPDGYVAIALTDVGCGIPAEQIDRVFEPFFTTKEVGRGTGLGLSQVFGFAKQSRGDVSVDSTVGQGTTFTVFLPRVVAQAASAAHAASSLEASGNMRVLLVDDNADVLRATGDALRDRGFHVETEPSADAALARADGIGAIDVVLTDVVMPGMSGLDFARELRGRDPTVPVVLATGYSDAIERSGPDGFTVLRKPYGIDELIACLMAAIHATDQESV